MNPKHWFVVFAIASTFNFVISGSLTLAHSQNTQMSFIYGFFCVKF